MLTVKIPSELERRLEAVAEKIGRSKQDVALEGIAEQIQDLEDGLTAIERVQDGNTEWFSLEEVRDRLRLSDGDLPE